MMAYIAEEFRTGSVARMTTIYVGGTVMGGFSGRFIERLGLQRSLLSALTMSTAGLMTTLSPSLPVIIIGLAACASGVFICQAVTISFIAANVSEGRSLAMGLYNMCYYAVGAVATWVTGIVYEARGWSGSVMSIVVFQMVAGRIAWFGWHNSRGK